MAAVQTADPDPAGPIGRGNRALAQAALVATRAPSVFNSQPWRWRISRGVAQLWADRSRQIRPIDPDGRLLVLSCGAALHHLRLSLAVAGWTASVRYLPDAAEPDLLAGATLAAPGAPTPQTLRLYRAIAARRTDRRPFADHPVAADVLDELRRVVEAAGASLVIPAENDLLALTVAAGHAAATELADPSYRSALASWVDRPASSGDGVPAATAAPPALRPVPLRDFLAHAKTSVTADPPPVGDRHASYAVVATAGDRPADWLTAGEALSALLLTATAHGLSTSPMTDLVEVPASRSLLRELLTDGHPALVVRIGVPAAEPPATALASRRPGPDVVRVADHPGHDDS